MADFFGASPDPRIGPPFPAGPSADPAPVAAAPRRSITIPLPTIAVPSFQACFNLIVVVVLLWHSGVHPSFPHVGPIPLPIPTPAPAIVGPIAVTYLVDGSAITPAQGAIRRSSALRAALAALDAGFGSLQSDQAEAGPFKSDATSFPCAVVRDSTGKTLAVLKDPKEADIIDAVKTRRGK